MVLMLQPVGWGVDTIFGEAEGEALGEAAIGLGEALGRVEGEALGEAAIGLGEAVPQLMEDTVKEAMDDDCQMYPKF